MKKILTPFVLVFISFVIFSNSIIFAKDLKKDIKEIKSEAKEYPENSLPQSIKLIEQHQKDSKKQEKTEDDSITVKANKVIININGENWNGKAEAQKTKESEEENSIVKDVNPQKQINRFKDFAYKVWDDIKRLQDFEHWGRVLLMLFGSIFAVLMYKLVRWFFEKYLAKRYARKTKTEFDDKMLIALSPCLALFVFIVIAFLCSYPLMRLFPRFVFATCGRLSLAIAAWSIVWYLYRLVAVLEFYLNKLAMRTDNNLDNLIVSLIRKTLKVFIVVTGVLFIGKNILSIDITTLLASAGVVGLAVAFAAKDTIANFFGSIMITLDRPFKHGDRVKIDGYDGIVDNVGFRSTVIKTLIGHNVSIPNKKLAEVVIENISARKFIKFTPVIGLTYDTPPGKVEEAIKILEDEYNDMPPCSCDIFHEYDMDDPDNPHRAKVMFDSFGDFSLNLNVTAWYHPGDYFEAMIWHSKVNLNILKRFNDAGIEFAFPSSTIYVAGDEQRKLQINVKND